nr:EF-P lysine aminoacylase GenX [Desulfobulbaceae bacterium]
MPTKVSSTLKILEERAAITQAVRSFFIARSFLEVETPIRIPAPAPETHIEPQKSEGWFLQTSPELCMKRLLASGCNNIFQICKCFRKGERGRLHLPEMTMLEWYRTNADYQQLMHDCENLLRFLIPNQNLVLGNKTINLNGPWLRITIDAAFKQFARMSLETALSTDSFEEILVVDVEPKLGINTPVFLIDYPAEMASLARLNPITPQTAQRFELYIDGIELANGFSELNDPVEQRLRFEKEREVIHSAGRSAGPMPENFLNDLGAMPDSAGIALGLDRLVMLLTNSQCIDQVVTFTPETV